jgi:hypothetical protein
MAPEESLMQLRARAWYDDIELRRNDTADDGTDGEAEADDDEDDDFDDDED